MKHDSDEFIQVMSKKSKSNGIINQDQLAMMLSLALAKRTLRDLWFQLLAGFGSM
jgi:hypothetical protein